MGKLQISGPSGTETADVVWGNTVRYAPNLREALKIAYADRKKHGSQILLRENDGTILVGPMSSPGEANNLSIFLPKQRDGYQTAFDSANAQLIGIIGKDTMIQLDPTVSLARPHMLDKLLGGELPSAPALGDNGAVISV